ncbi:unnamed protein product [Darwinula stevensoni]|uniref:Uncharacterized protein n=1 Tax=Darwinula stevensoni TaxID=69355 RepID=A0A7R8XF14_9CRUS|nr:unnamed protein product [Darwinula stevensoni]CAG0895034.1 unnamed protein product [Darwinula stevensoni]
MREPLAQLPRPQPKPRLPEQHRDSFGSLAVSYPASLVTGRQLPCSSCHWPSVTLLLLSLAVSRIPHS